MLESLSNTDGTLGKMLNEISRVVVGKDNLKEMLLVALLSGGHVLIEGLSGTARLPWPGPLPRSLAASLSVYSSLLICCPRMSLDSMPIRLAAKPHSILALYLLI